MPRGNFPWYLQRFEPVHCGRALCVHCTCTVRALSKHTPTHTHVPSWGWKHTGLCRSQEWQKKKTDGDCERHMSPSMSMNWLCPTEAVKNPEKDFYIEISYNKYVGSYIHTNIRTYIQYIQPNVRTCRECAARPETRRQDFCRRYPHQKGLHISYFKTAHRASERTYICSYMQISYSTHIHTYIHTYTYNTCKQTYIHTYRQTDIHTYVRTYIHTCMHAYIRHMPNACVLTVHAQCTHSARHSARSSARAENVVNSTSSAEIAWNHKKKYPETCFFFVFDA